MTEKGALSYYDYDLRIGFGGCTCHVRPYLLLSDVLLSDVSPARQVSFRKL